MEPSKPTPNSRPLYLDQNKSNVTLDRLFSWGAEVNQGENPSLTIEASHIRPHLSLLPKSLDNWTIESANLQKSLMSSIRSSQPPSLFFYPTALKNTVSKITTVKIAIDSTKFDVPVEQLFCSEHFCNLLENMTISTGWVKSTVPTIDVEDKYSSEAYVKLISFLKARTSKDRKTSLQGTPIPTLVDLYQLSVDLKIPALTTLVRKKIETLTILETDCVQLLNATIISGLEDKQAACLKFIQDKKITSCLLQTVQHNLPFAAEELAKNDTGPWYVHNQCQAIKRAISDKNVRLTEILLKHAKLTEQHAPVLVERALASGDAKILGVVLSAVKKAFSEQLNGWVKMETALAYKTPDLWLAIRKVCPTHLDLKEQELLIDVLKQGREPWITKFFELNLYKENQKILHHVTQPNILTLLEQRLKQFEDVQKSGDSVELSNKKSDISFSELLNVRHKGVTPFGRAMKRETSEMAIAFLKAHKRHSAPIAPDAFTHTHLTVVTDWLAKTGLKQQKDALLEWAVFLREKGPRPDIAHKMLEAEANANLISEKVSILDKMVETNLLKMGEYLFPKVNSDLKMQAVTKAVREKRWNWVEFFIDQGLWKEWTSLGGATLLHHTAKEGQNELVKKLVDLGADPYQEDLKGYTPFDVAKDNSVFDSETCVIS